MRMQGCFFRCQQTGFSWVPSRHLWLGHTTSSIPVGRSLAPSPSPVTFFFLFSFLWRATLVLWGARSGLSARVLPPATCIACRTGASQQNHCPSWPSCTARMHVSLPTSATARHSTNEKKNVRLFAMQWLKYTGEPRMSVSLWLVRDPTRLSQPCPPRVAQPSPMETPHRVY